MDEIVEALAAEQAELVALVGDAGPEALARPSRCEGWSVADVLLHLAQTNEMAIASATGTFEEEAGALSDGLRPVTDVDDWAAAAVEKERGDVVAIRDRFVASTTAQVDAFADTDPSARVPWVAGLLAARSLCTTRLSETWIHHNDVAVAFGDLPAPTDRLRHIARLAWRTVPYAFMRADRELAGPVAFELEAPDGSTWTFAGDEPAATTLTGTAIDLCTVAGQRARAADTGLQATGPDAAAVLELVRTFA